MKQRALWSAVVVAGLALAGCGSATGSAADDAEGSDAQGNGAEGGDAEGGDAEGGDAEGGDAEGRLVVWDWKSADESAAAYIERARADFAEKHPNVEVEFVAQPFDQYYTLLGGAIQAGAGPDVILFNGGGQIRDRADSLVPLDDYLAEDQDRLAGWDAFARDGQIYAAPVTLQGHPIYYNRELYEEAGLDPDNPATTWDEFVSNCDSITDATGAHCFALGNQEGIGIEFFLSAMGSAVLTSQEYDDWIAGDRDWNSPGVRRIFELWTEANDAGLNNEAPNSTAMFNDSFAIFQSGEASHVIGLMSDIGHWKDFSEFLGAENVGVMQAPLVEQDAVPNLPYDGGIGYAVAEWTSDPELAADLVRSLTSTAALEAFFDDAGAIAADTTIDASGAGPSVAAIVAELETGEPALHVALSSETLELMGRLSQQLLSGSATVDEAMEQLAASDQAS
ncbi:ABC transporter substrate-binding protein [Phytoactinopolyspora mesophila]|uniref:Extracellular solute-binding protein n=1 Tax=Phytoactinopolyspora mesophila TaxID=2650750 RepID=A0A7K3M2A4_9ACTN|nr:extracellular solute-binding protein [Phytoactinopolyspora mesophila]NDL57052.1 extracellular solute-binding protein [Phytoactinopolyspora mesophila]